MTADTYSNTLGFLAMGTGNDNNSWGNNANTAVFQIFEDAIANTLSSAVTGGTLDLSGSPPPAAASQARYAALIFTGTLTGAQSVKVPNLTKWWWVNNQTSGAFALTIKTPSGSASTSIPQNSGWQLVQCDGANNIIVSPFNSQQIQMPDFSPDGNAAYSWINEPSAGLYRSGSHDFRYHIAGNDILQITDAGVNVITGFLKVGGVAVATGSAVTAVATPTAGHIAQWASPTTIQDGGVLGTLAALSSVTAANLDSGGSSLDQWALTNLSIAATVGSNLLTVTLNGANGSTPSASNPVLVNFSALSGSAQTGAPTLVSVTAALSISTNATGATLGSSNNKPFRLWIVIFNNAGTPVLALINCSTASGIFSLNEATVVSTTAISGSATLPGVFYTPNGTTLTSCAFRILGFLSYETALVTAGTYNNAPDLVQLFGPGVKKPGDVVQTVYATSTANTSLGTSNAFAKLTPNLSITPTSKINPVAVTCNGSVGTTTQSAAPSIYVALSKGNAFSGIGNWSMGAVNASIYLSMPFSLYVFDLPGTMSAVTYSPWGTTTSSQAAELNASQIGSGGTTICKADELMG